MTENRDRLEDLEDIREVDVDFNKVSPNRELDLEEIKEAIESLRNVPYVKIFDSEGNLVNPITKDKPYLNYFMNGRDRRAAVRKETRNPKNNKKGTRVVITKISPLKFVKTWVTKQIIKLSETKAKVRVITHNRIKKEIII